MPAKRSTPRIARFTERITARPPAGVERSPGHKALGEPAAGVQCTMKPTTPNWQNEQPATVHFADATEAMDYLRSRGWTWERAIPAGSVWAHPRVNSHNYWLRSGSVAEAGPDTWTITAISRC
jgi:hypothetical protein